jgi:hypothetical protein
VGELNETDRAILDFERQWWKYAGAKEQAIRDKFDLSSTRYYQRLNRIINDPAALAYDAALVRRLQAIRARRKSSPLAAGGRRAVP